MKSCLGDLSARFRNQYEIFQMDSFGQLVDGSGKNCPSATLKVLQSNLGSIRFYSREKLVSLHLSTCYTLLNPRWRMTGRRNG